MGFRKVFAEVRIAHLDRFEDGVKVIGNGELGKKLTVKVHRISAGAKSIVESAGGSVELIPDKKKWERADTRAARRSKSS